MLPRYENKIKEIQSMMAHMLERIIKGSELSYQAYQDHCSEEFDAVKNELKSIEADANAIDNEIIKTFAMFGPEANELRSLVAYLKMTNELVRIGEGVKKYARRMKEHCASECDLAPLDNVIVQLHKSSLNALQYIYECFSSLEECEVEEYYRKVMVEESKNDDLFAILEKDILNQIMKNSTEISIELVRVLGTLRKLERSCDRSVNIATLMMYVKHGGHIHLYRNGNSGQSE